jgi:hypothetical protein
MLRRVFTLLSALSLLLCAGACVLWVRSYYVWYAWDWDDAGTRHTVGSSGGRVFYDHVTPGSARSRPVGFHSNLVGSTRGSVLAPTWSFAGFRMTRAQSTGNVSFDLRIPYWLPTSLTAISALVALRQRLRHERAVGLCPTCGYDLRATPGRCPECGTVQRIGVS